MHKNRIHTTGSLILLAICLTVSCLAAPGKREDDAARDHAKARYYYIEGSAALAEGRTSEGYELIKRAAKIHKDFTDYPEASYAYALMRMTLRNDTLQSPAEISRSIRMMRPFVDKYPEESSEAMNYSFLAARSGDLDEAIRVAERTESLDTDLTTTLLQLAQYYAAKQDHDKAIKALEKYERIEGCDPDISLRKLSLLLSKGDTTGLLKESDRLVRENPLGSDYLIIRGNVLEVLNMPDSALSCYLRAEAINPDDGKTKLTLANYYLQQGDSAGYDRKSSEALLSENIMLDEKLEMMTRYMHNIIADSADTRRGARLFDALLLQYPHETRVLDLGAQFSAATGDMARAEELMSYATDLDPDNPDYWTRLATFYYTDDRNAEAIATCEKGIEKLKESAPRGIWLVYGAAASMADDYGKAREVYQSLLDMELPGTLLTDSASSVMQKAGHLPYESLVRVADIYSMAGDVSYRAGDMPRSLREYEVSYTLNPANIMTLNNYAYYLALSGGDLEKAEELSRRTVTDQPDNPTYIDTLAWILYLEGKYDEALTLQEGAIEKASAQNDMTGEYWDHLGDIQYRCGQKDKALESWKKALQLDKDNKDLIQKVKNKRLPDRK